MDIIYHTIDATGRDYLSIEEILGTAPQQQDSSLWASLKTLRAVPQNNDIEGHLVSMAAAGHFGAELSKKSVELMDEIKQEARKMKDVWNLLNR